MVHARLELLEAHLEVLWVVHVDIVIIVIQMSLHFFSIERDTTLFDMIDQLCRLIRDLTDQFVGPVSLLKSLALLQAFDAQVLPQVATLWLFAVATSFSLLIAV